jgi:hypothetical protein
MVETKEAFSVFIKKTQWMHSDRDTQISSN